MFPSISSNSTLAELLSVIRLSFERNECNEAERILIRREQNFRNELQDLRIEVENLRKQRHLLATLHELTETQKNSADKELEKRKVECEELSERVNRVIDEHKSLVDSKIKAVEMHRKEMAKVKRAEFESLKTIEELKRRNNELEEEIEDYKDDCQQRIFKLEEIVADLLGIHVSDVRNGNHLQNSCRTSTMARFSNDSGENHSSPRHNQERSADNCDIEVCERIPTISSPIVAADGPNGECFAGSCDIDVCKRIPTVSSPIAAADGPNNLIILIDTDDENTPAEPAVIAKTCDINLNSCLKEMPLVMCSVKTEKSDGMKDSSLILPNGRKRSLINGDEDNRSPMSRQKTLDTGKIFSDDKGWSNMYGSVALSTVSSDCSSTDSDDDIETTTAKLRRKKWKSAADLLSEFERNYELCMEAVCVLYRRTISVEKSTSDPFNHTTTGFSHFVATSGKELAEYLIKGDQKHLLSRSVAEVKETCPEVLERCRALATQYNEKLFEIYCKAEDHYFRCMPQL